jgi:hypothetical protein
MPYENDDLFNIDNYATPYTLKRDVQHEIKNQKNCDTIENRNTIINNDDILNLQIALNTSVDLDSFLALI